MTNLADCDREHIRQNIDLPTEQLLAELGSAVLEESGGLGAFPPSIDELIAIGKEALASKRVELCSLISLDPVARDFLGRGETYDRAEAACIVADIILTAVGRPTYLWMSICIARYGLAVFCRGCMR